MKTKENNKNNNLIDFLKFNWVKLALIVLSLFVLIILSAYFIPNWIGRKKFENDIEAIYNTSPVFSLSKIYCYSNATGINNSEQKAMWDLNISQYTDIALYINIHNKDNEKIEEFLKSKNIDSNTTKIMAHTEENTISQLYIDNINFSNSDTGKLSLNYLPILNFGAVPELDTDIQPSDIISFNIIDDPKILLDTNSLESQPTIDKNLSIPITLRYLNHNLKTNHLITNIKENLFFDGSILKRSSIPLSSIKNELSFTIHIINKANEEYVYKVNLEIPLQNEDNSKNIYDGDFSKEFSFKNSYFYKKEN